MFFAHAAGSGYRTRMFSISLALLLCAAGLRAENTSNTNIYAQTLIGPVMAKHPHLLVLGLHAVAPGSTEHHLIACSKISIIGEADDADDTAAAVEQKTIIAPNLKDGRIEILLPLKEVSGEVIGAAVFVYNYHKGDDQTNLYEESVAIRDGLKGEIHSLAGLFAQTH